MGARLSVTRALVSLVGARLSVTGTPLPLNGARCERNGRAPPAEQCAIERKGRALAAEGCVLRVKGCACPAEGCAIESKAWAARARRFTIERNARASLAKGRVVERPRRARGDDHDHDHDHFHDHDGFGQTRRRASCARATTIPTSPQLRHSRRWSAPVRPKRDPRSQERAHVNRIEVEPRERPGQRGDPFRDRQRRVHHDERLAAQPTQPPLPFEQPVAEALDAHGDAKSRRERLQLGKHARGRHEASVPPAPPAAEFLPLAAP
jgi:hypothetical protein